MKAIFSVEFKKRNMCDQKTVNEVYGGSWLKLMKYLFKEEGFGIFDTDKIKLIKLEE